MPTAANGITRNVFKFQRKCGSNNQIANGCAKPAANCLITSYYNIAVSNAQLACRLQCVQLLDYIILFARAVIPTGGAVILTECP